MLRFAQLSIVFIVVAFSMAVSASSPPPPRGPYPLRHNGEIFFLYGDPSNTLVCSPLVLCIVILESGERIVRNGVHLGDTVRWQIKPTVGANETTHVVLKPFDVNLDTSLALVTDRRTYNLRITSSESGAMPLVSFHYPDTVDAAWQDYYRDRAAAEERRRLPEMNEDISLLDFMYEIIGCSECSWRPLRVYNNGKLTILHMGPGIHHGEVPAFYVETTQGMSMVNYRIQGDRYIADRVFDRGILILGVGKDQQRVDIIRLQGGQAKSKSIEPEVFSWLD